MTNQMSIKQTKKILNVSEVKRGEVKVDERPMCERCGKRRGEFYLSAMCKSCWDKSKMVGDQN